MFLAYAFEIKTRSRARSGRGARKGGHQETDEEGKKMTDDKTPAESPNLSALSDLCTPWCIHVVATLRIAAHPALQ
jgi:hypothetical protein